MRLTNSPDAKIKKSNLLPNLNYDDMRLFWTHRVAVLQNWLTQELKLSSSQQLPIIMPTEEVGLKSGVSGKKQLSDYIKQHILSPDDSLKAAEYKNKPRLACIPMLTEDGWTVLFLAINDNNCVTTAYCSEVLSSERRVDGLLRMLKVDYSDYNFTDKCFLLNQAGEKLSAPLKPYYSSSRATSIQEQIQKADPVFRGTSLYRKFAYFNNDRSSSVFLCIENAMELIKIFYTKGKYIVRPKWLNSSAVLELYAEYKATPALRLHPKLRKSSKRLLYQVWRLLEEDVFKPLEERLKAHGRLYHQHGGLTKAEKEHLFRFLGTLKKFREKIAASKNELEKLTTKPERLDFLMKGVIRVQAQAQWCDSVLKNLITTGNDDRYEVYSKNKLGKYTRAPVLKVDAQLKSLVKIRQSAIKNNNKLALHSYFTTLHALFIDCRHAMQATLQQLEKEVREIDAFCLAQQPKEVGDHSKASVIGALSKASGNAYDFLGIKRDATASEIDKAFRKRSLRVHPDRDGDENLMKVLNDAHDAISDPKKKILFDQKLQLIETLEEDELSVENFLQKSQDGVSPFYRAKHEECISLCEETPMSQAILSQYFKPIEVKGLLFKREYERMEFRDVPRQIQREEQHSVRRKKTKIVQREVRRRVKKKLGTIEFLRENVQIIKKRSKEKILVFIISMLIFNTSVLPAFYRADQEREEGVDLWIYVATELLIFFFSASIFYSLVTDDRYFGPPALKKTKKVKEKVLKEVEKPYFVDEIVTKIITETVYDKKSFRVMHSVIADNVFSFGEKLSSANLSNQVDFHGELTLKRAISLFRRFLKGDYFGRGLSNLKAYFKLSMQIIRGKNASEKHYFFQTMLNLMFPASSQKTPLSMMHAFKQIIDYAKRHYLEKDASSIRDLLADRYFRLLFSQTLLEYWKSPCQILAIPKTFDSRAELLQRINKLSEAGDLTNNKVSVESIRLLTDLYQFESLLYEKIGDNHVAGSAAAYREKAYFCLDSIVNRQEMPTPMARLNLIIQAAVYFQCASVCDGSASQQMADQSLALLIYTNAISIAEKEGPHLALYAYSQILHYLGAFRYVDEEVKSKLHVFQHRALRLFDLFPTFEMHHSHLDCLQDTGQLFMLMQLHLVHLEDNLGKTDHDESTVLSMVYEACLNDWYSRSKGAAKLEQLRQKLVRAVLIKRGWTRKDIARNIASPWVMVDRNPEGWLLPRRALSLPRNNHVEVFKSINGFLLDYNTGKVTLLTKPWRAGDALYKRRFTTFDLLDLLKRNLTHAEFSLDGVDPDIPYHPFNHMRYSPTVLHGSELLNTMLLTDYLLKFFTVGFQPNATLPYTMKPVGQLIAHLPVHLKKIITDFHASGKTEASAHRFWIEADHLPVATTSLEEIKKLGKNSLILGKLRMVVRKHKMIRGVDGELIDDPNERSEGWPLYVMGSKEAVRKWLKLPKSGRPNYAMIFLRNAFSSYSLYFWEEEELSRAPLANKSFDNLDKFFKLKRDSSGEVLKTASNAELLYHFTREITQAMCKPHHFTPEYVFAQALTADYDELSKYFSEFGRLKALSRMTTVVGFLNNVRKNNVKTIEFINTTFNDSTHKTWRNLRANALCFRMGELWHSKGKEDINKIINKYEAAGKILINRFSYQSTLEKAFKRKFEKEKTQYIERNGFMSQFRKYAPTLQSVKKKYGHKEKEILNEWVSETSKCNQDEFISGLFSKIGASWNDEMVESCKKAFFEEKNIIPLAFALSVHNRTENYYSLQSALNIDISDTEILQILLRNEDVIFSVETRLSNRSPNSPLLKPRSEQRFKEHAAVRKQLSACKALGASLSNMGLGKKGQEKDLTDVCTWVPAAMSQSIVGNRSRFVYGGVRILPRVKEYKGDHQKARQIRQKVMLHPRTQTLDASKLGKQARSAASAMPVYQSTSNLAQQARFFQAQEAKRRGAAQQETNARGRTNVRRAGAPIQAAGGSSGGSGLPPSTNYLAKKIASAFGKSVISLRDKGYKIEIPHGSRRIVIRIMDYGGGRKNYYRVSIDGKQAFTKTGEPSMDRALTHMKIEATSYNDIINIVRKVTNDLSSQNKM